MKVLICGLGSIGQRHVRLLKDLLGDQVEIAAWRNRGQNIVVKDNMQALTETNPEEYYGIGRFDTLEEALSWKPDVAFITNPISMHIPVALSMTQAGCHIFIEKPLGASLVGINDLIKQMQERALTCAVGYQMRFHPVVERIKELIDEGSIGKLCYADVHFGEWLPGMHPYEDYRISHAARNDQGGGAILCLSHDIDYFLWLFGMPERVYCAGGHLSSLEMDVEDTAEILLNYSLNESEFIARIHLNFLQKPAQRYCRIVGSDGWLHWDYHSNLLTTRSNSSSDIHTEDFSDFQRNNMFVAEQKDFLDSIKDKRDPRSSIQSGLDTMVVSLLAKKSMADKQAIAVPADTDELFALLNYV